MCGFVGFVGFVVMVLSVLLWGNLKRIPKQTRKGTLAFETYDINDFAYLVIGIL